MLRVVRGNRAETLAAALVDALPAIDPFAPTTIVVGSRLVARWLQRELARARGIAAGVELVPFERFVERAWAGDAAGREARLFALDRAQLAAAIASVLADPSMVAALPAVAAYLGDRAQEDAPRRVQLAEQVAELAWQYALTRPDWLPALVAGKVPSELADHAPAKWQAALLAAAIARVETDERRVALAPMLPWLRRRAGVAAPQVGELHVFGMSYFARAQLEALSDLAAANEVVVYLLDPCEPLWDDAPGRARARAPGADDPLPLALWGGALRGTLGALVERSAGNVDDVFAAPARTDARAALLADVLERRADGEPAAPHGVEVLACPNARRELEAVASTIRARLDADPSLRAHEIAVWIAGDADRYAALAPAAFDAVGVPCHLIDAPVDDRGRIGEAVLALLELPTSELRRRELLAVMTHPALLAAHPHVDSEDWVRWTERLGISHGANAKSRAGTYLEPFAGYFHWDQGVRRLALGAFMASERGAAVMGDRELLPEDVEPEQQASAATYALLVRSLCEDADWLRTHEDTLAEWARIFVGLLDAYLGPGADDERVRDLLASIARVDLDGRRVAFTEARELARRRLATARATRGEALAAGVMIAPLRAMRAIPFRFACVVGLAEGEFPSGDQPSSLDARRTPRALDVSPRDRDRHAFLEVLLGTREALVLSYVAAEAKSGQPLSPSSLVLELADALAPYLGAASGKAALALLTRRVPLHRFADASDDVLPAAERERWGVRTREALRAHVRARDVRIPDADAMLEALADDRHASLSAELGLVAAPSAVPEPRVRPLSLANVRAFLESPVQAWAQAVLGLDDAPDDEAFEHSSEPFHVDKPARAMLLRDALAAHLCDPARDLRACYDHVARTAELRGQFPVGVFGDVEREVDLATLERWRDELGPVQGASRLAFGRARGDAELVPPLALVLSGGRTIHLVGQTELLARAHDHRVSLIALVRVIHKHSPYHLRGALDHVVLAAAELATNGHAHVLVDREGNIARVHHARWQPADARAYLAELVGELLDAPHGYVLPFATLANALQGKPPSRSFDASERRIGYGPIERIDGLVEPSAAEVAAIAHRRLAPLVERMTGDHGFAIGDGK